MIKKVRIEQLEPGVFIHDFNCDLKSNKLVTNQALIQSTKIIEILDSWGSAVFWGVVEQAERRMPRTDAAIKVRFIG